ncbi:MAG: dihydroorotase [Micavibrio aeruginosavorus]|uniref:Dihydroorotase n=1 Tax=Micavibrio aeruginosavorus TaxID=349221 RepID=A0A2W5N158_9BACT|nr:MAG: dihydroorotase [Micavibrio aeruginosavorus]
MNKRITLPKWYDLHVHVRQGPAMEAYIAAHLSMGCAGILAMPNTKPPVAKIRTSDPLPYWSVEEYRDMILKAGGNAFSTVITPLYLTKDTTPAMIEAGVKSGLLKACKYYPPHGTTNADHGRPLRDLMDNGVIKALEDNGVILCLHGEEHALSGEQYFGRNSNAEDYFYRERMPRLRNQHPNLKMVCEHITTKTAADFVEKSGDKTGATITPQHLLYTMGDLVQGLKYHLYCLPLVKFEEDRQALLSVVRKSGNTRFFAGTDSAPHTTKATECGCAAGCFTGGIAPQLYAESFDLEHDLEIFKAFLCTNGANFYGLPVPIETFDMVYKDMDLEPLDTKDGNVLPLPLGLGQKTLRWSIA